MYCHVLHTLLAWGEVIKLNQDVFYMDKPKPGLVECLQSRTSHVGLAATVNHAVTCITTNLGFVA
jgi:hypothetical protein